MKAIVLITIFCLYLVQTSRAQTDSPDHNKPYLTWITTYDAARSTTGVLYEINDSSVTLSNRSVSRPGSPGKLDLTKIDVRSIDEIKLRKNGNVGKGVLYGALAGLIVGGTIGIVVASTSEKHDEGANNFEKSLNSAANSAATVGSAILIGIGCIGTGIGIGAIIGSAKITISISGSQQLFDQNKMRLNDYSVKYIEGLGNKTFSKLQEILVDIDGNSYKTLALGGQVWMADDLKVLHYQDGSEILNVTANSFGPGHQYQWDAVADSRKICPSNWHVPSPGEWTSLFNSLGGESGAVRKMGADFSAGGEMCQWWSSAEQGADLAQSLYFNNTTLAVFLTGTAKTFGLSVRCLRDNQAP